MTKLAVSLLAGAAALAVTGSAQAAPLVPTAPVVDDGIQNVRLVCNEWGRCWQTRGPRYTTATPITTTSRPIATTAVIITAALACISMRRACTSASASGDDDLNARSR